MVVRGVVAVGESVARVGGAAGPVDAVVMIVEPTEFETIFVGDKDEDISKDSVAIVELVAEGGAVDVGSTTLEVKVAERAVVSAVVWLGSNAVAEISVVG